MRHAFCHCKIVHHAARNRATRARFAGNLAWRRGRPDSAGAHASAVIYSLVQTAQANGVEPYQWLCQVLRDLPAAKNVEDVEALLPWNIGAASARENISAGVAP